MTTVSFVTCQQAGKPLDEVLACAKQSAASTKQSTRLVLDLEHDGELFMQPNDTLQLRAAADQPIDCSELAYAAWTVAQTTGREVHVPTETHPEFCGVITVGMTERQALRELVASEHYLDSGD